MKYYTPTEDEFFNGFEYIENEITKVYHNRILGIENLKIKYLDVEDILKLGFTLEENKDGVYKFNKMFFGESPSFYELIFKLEDRTLTLNEVNQFKTTNLFLNFHLKNISELKWILNRYGIL